MPIDRYTPLVSIPWYPGLFMRRAMVANALSVVGYHGGAPDTYDAFQRLLGPATDGRYGIWPLRQPYGRGGISTCAMVALGLLRRLGVQCPDIQDGYHDDMGSGLNTAIQCARKQSPPAWVSPIPGIYPELGDIVQVVGPMHVCVVVGYEKLPDGTLTCVSVDGGQVGLDGLQQISLCRRPWCQDRLGGRRVDGWIDVDLLPYCGVVEVPEGWEDVLVPPAWELVG